MDERTRYRANITEIMADSIGASVVRCCPETGEPLAEVIKIPVKEPIMETPRIIESIARIPLNAAKHVVERLTGGGWSSLPDTSTTEPKPPVRASITYISTPEVPHDEAA